MDKFCKNSGRYNKKTKKCKNTNKYTARKKTCKEWEVKK